MHRIFIATALAALTPVSIPAIGAEIKPGLWEITVQSEMAGMPAKPPAVTVKQCYRAEDVKDPKNMVPRQQDAGMKCDTLDYKTQGNTATWRLQCTGQGMTMSGRGSMTMNGDSYSGNSTMDMNAGGRSMKMSQTMNGKRVGDCK